MITVCFNSSLISLLSTLRDWSLIMWEGGGGGGELQNGKSSRIKTDSKPAWLKPFLSPLFFVGVKLELPPPPPVLWRVTKGHGVWYPGYGTLHIKDPLPFFKKSRVVIPVVGFSYISSHRFDHQILNKLPTLLSP